MENTPEFINKAIQMRIKQEVEKLVEEVKKDLEKKTPEIVASVVVDMMKLVQFQTYQDRVVFEIKKF